LLNQGFHRLALGRKAALAAAGLTASLFLYLGMMTAPVSRASAVEAFCENVNLPAYGQYGDHCYAWVWEAHPYLLYVAIQTKERAGCVTYAGGSGYDLKDSWQCIGNYSYGYRYTRRSAEALRGVIRNNNLTYSGHFTGSQSCCWEH
jgi:hypothetical protein